MQEREKRREGSRRAREARERREQVRQRRKVRTQLIAGSVGALAIIGIILGVVFANSGGPDVGQSVTELPGFHNPPYDYNSRPPTSGNHTSQWLAYGYIGRPLPAESAVHNMEHGAVVIWHQPDDPELAGQVNRLVGQLGNRCIVAGPYANMDAKVAATAWGRILTLDTFDAEQLRAFVSAYRGKRGPEAGLCETDAGGGVMP